MSADYYSRRLQARRLRRCYELAPPRVARYLRAEIEHVAARLRPGDRVLEIGCGYGRVLAPLAARAGSLVGVDTSVASLRLAREPGTEVPPRVGLMAGDATNLGFPDGVFDVVLCVQNGLSAFGVEPRTVIAEALRVTRPGGRLSFSSYSERFWEDRLEWFRLQADEGLIGEIDESATGNGVIVCRDGFRATTHGPDAYRALARDLGATAEITEVDGSSLFCHITRFSGGRGRR